MSFFSPRRLSTSPTATSFHITIFFFYTLSVDRVLESIPAVLGEGGATSWMSCHFIESHRETILLTSSEKSDLSVSLMSEALHRGGRPEYPDRSRTDHRAKVRGLRWEPPGWESEKQPSCCKAATPKALKLEAPSWKKDRKWLIDPLSC